MKMNTESKAQTPCVFTLGLTPEEARDLRGILSNFAEDTKNTESDRLFGQLRLSLRSKNREDIHARFIDLDVSLSEFCNKMDDIKPSGLIGLVIYAVTGGRILPEITDYWLDAHHPYVHRAMLREGLVGGTWNTLGDIANDRLLRLNTPDVERLISRLTQASNNRYGTINTFLSKAFDGLVQKETLEDSDFNLELNFEGLENPPTEAQSKENPTNGGMLTAFEVMRLNKMCHAFTFSFEHAKREELIQAAFKASPLAKGVVGNISSSAKYHDFKNKVMWRGPLHLLSFFIEVATSGRLSEDVAKETLERNFSRLKALHLSYMKIRSLFTAKTWETPNDIRLAQKSGVPEDLADPKDLQKYLAATKQAFETVQTLQKDVLLQDSRPISRVSPTLFDIVIEALGLTPEKSRMFQRMLEAYTQHRFSKPMYRLHKKAYGRIPKSIAAQRNMSLAGYKNQVQGATPGYLISFLASVACGPNTPPESVEKTLVAASKKLNQECLFKELFDKDVVIVETPYEAFRSGKQPEVVIKTMRAFNALNSIFSSCYP